MIRPGGYEFISSMVFIKEMLDHLKNQSRGIDLMWICLTTKMKLGLGLSQHDNKQTLCL